MRKSSIKATFSAIPFLLSPTVAFAAPGTLAGGVNTTAQLIGQGVQWFLILFAAALVFFIVRAGFKMSGAEDDSDAKIGKRQLTRSITGFILAILANVIVAYIRNAYGL